MNTMEIAKKLVEFCRQGNDMEALALSSLMTRSAWKQLL